MSKAKQDITKQAYSDCKNGLRDIYDLLYALVERTRVDRIFNYVDTLGTF